MESWWMESMGIRTMQLNTTEINATEVKKMEDEEIIKLFFLRSELAIEAVAEKYGAVCRKIANNILRNEQDVEECVNDTYLGLWESIPPNRPNPFLAYICRVVRNISIKRYHYNKAKKRDDTYNVAMEELENCFASADTVESRFEAEQLTELINCFLEMQDKKNRVIFVRRYWFADSVSDIAKRMHMSNHVVTVRLSRLRKKFETYLKKEGIGL